MFTGIIEELGIIEQIRKHPHSAVFQIKAAKIPEDLKIGDSIAVNGVCLTVTSFDQSGFTADVMHETINRSTLFQLQPGACVNLERAMPANGRFGGHIVAGHVDGTGKIIQIKKDENAIWYTIGAGASIMKYIVEKGSVAIDGISLTVASVRENCFSISAIPHTVNVTALKMRKQGDIVNLETDIIGKYVEKFLQNEHPSAQENKITQDFLIQHGYL